MVCYNSVTGQSYIVVKVHAHGCWDKAIWDGESVVLGDGCHHYIAMTATDVVAHEVAHGYTEFTSNLEYSGESGCLSEAFSDMAGRCRRWQMLDIYILAEYARVWLSD